MVKVTHRLGLEHMATIVDMTDSSGGITVGELMTLPHLRLRLLAGDGGLGREVSWAHVFDHTEPWDWLEPGDLVLTSGWMIPADPAQQAGLTERMAEAGFAGMLAADAPQCPPLSDDMIDAANRCSFPIGVAPYETSLAEICRSVQRANQTREGRIVNAIMRVQDEVRAGLVKGRSSAELLAAIGKTIGCNLYVINPETCEPLLPGTAIPTPSWGIALAAALKERGGRAPTSIGLSVDGCSLIALPIPVERLIALPTSTLLHAFLCVDVSGLAAPRLALLEHVAAVLALELARTEAEFHKESMAGSSLLTDGLSGRIDPSAFEVRAQELGVEMPCLCVAIEGSEETIDRVDRYWLVRRIPHLTTSSMDGPSVTLIRSDEERIEEVRELSVAAGFRAGISQPIYGASALADASRQARWALETLNPTDTFVATYATNQPSFLPRTLLESQQTVECILGPILEYDAAHDCQLVNTLETYLACDRSPRRAAAVLFVHNQTVNYRIARIQELTGRSLRRTADISEFWFALKALALSKAMSPNLSVNGAESHRDLGTPVRSQPLRYR